MQMDVKYGLPGVPAIVDHHSVPVLFQTFLRCEGPRYEEQMTNDLSVWDRDAVDISDMFLGNDERMDWRFRINVVKSDCIVIFV